MAASARSIATRHSRGGGPGRAGTLVLGAGAAVAATGGRSVSVARVTATPSRKPASNRPTAASAMSRSTRSSRRGLGPGEAGSGRFAGSSSSGTPKGAPRPCASTPGPPEGFVGGEPLGGLVGNVRGHVSNSYPQNGDQTGSGQPATTNGQVPE